MTNLGRKALTSILAIIKETIFKCFLRLSICLRYCFFLNVPVHVCWKVHYIIFLLFVGPRYLTQKRMIHLGKVSTTVDHSTMSSIVITYAIWHLTKIWHNFEICGQTKLRLETTNICPETKVVVTNYLELYLMEYRFP